MFSCTLHPSMVVAVACAVAAYRIRGCHSHSDFTSNDCLLAWKCILLKRKGSHLLTILLKFKKHCPIGSSTNFPPFGHFRLFVKLFSQVNPKLFGILFTCFGGVVGRSEGGTKHQNLGQRSRPSWKLAILTTPQSVFYSSEMLGNYCMTVRDTAVERECGSLSKGSSITSVRQYANTFTMNPKPWRIIVCDLCKRKGWGRRTSIILI